MTATMTTTTLAASPPDTQAGSGHLVRRAVWLVAFASLLALAIFEAGRHHLGAGPILFFIVFPDVSFLAGAGVETEHGRLAPRAVPIYNFVHRPVVPLALVAAAAFGVVPIFWLVAGLSWLAHISIDRVVGYGLRNADGWQR